MSAVDRWRTFAKPEHAGWTWRLLSAAYSGADRHYHTIEHIESCLDLLDRVTDQHVDKTMAAIALFWHDSVYVPGCTHNEELSSDLLLGIGDALAVDRRVLSFAQRCILATKHACSWKFAGNPTVDAVVDIDLSILSVSAYPIYVADVRKEFAMASDAQWRVGRSTFLREMLARSRIYLSDCGHNWFEYAARENMTRELDALGTVAPDAPMR